MYDIFLVSKSAVCNNYWQTFKKRYPRSQKIDNVTSFDQIKSKAFTKFFWVVWEDLLVDESFDFSYKVSQWDNNYIHVYKNGEFFDGVYLISKTANISQREFENRFFVNGKKEIDIVASHPKPYDIYYIDTYDEYLNAIETATTDMFWVVWKEVVVNSKFKFDFKVPKYEQHIPHVFKNGKFFDGICIFPRTVKVTQREFENRFYVEKKEIDIVASIPRIFDIFFISYNESNADENYKALLTKVPFAKRIHGVKGIHQAHLQAAKESTSEMFWIVDGDAQVLEDFEFTVPQIPYYNLQERNHFNETVHVWKSQNPINNLTYGYGGIKLFPKKLTLNMDLTKPDMTTSISNNFKVMPTVSNITQFNTDPFTTWRSAFRECVKLSSNVIDRYYDKETDHRLQIWCTEGIENKYGEYAIDGAIEGKKYGENNIGNLQALSKINDFDWLKDKFENGR
jgi:hypothetical protein